MFKRVFGYLFLCVFAVGFGGGGVYMFTRIASQSRTASWPTAAEAEVTSSQVARSGDGYEPRIDYRYRVGTTWHLSSAVRKSGTFSSSDGTYAREMVARFPVGVTMAYVNPTDPADSVLVPGMDGHEYLMVSFAFPFAAIGATCLFCTVAWATRRRSEFIGQVRVFEPSPGITVVRANPLSPLLTGVVCTTAVAFVGVFIVLFALSSMPTVAVPLHFTAAAVAGAAGFVLRRRWLKQGRGDTVIDRNTGLLIPARGKAESADAVPLSQIRCVDTITEEKRGSEGNSRTFWTTAHIADSNKQLKLVSHGTRADAERFAFWMTERLSIQGSR